MVTQYGNTNIKLNLLFFLFKIYNIYNYFLFKIYKIYLFIYLYCVARNLIFIT